MTTLSLKRIAVLALPMAALAMTTSAQAQEWTPSRSIEFIAPIRIGRHGGTSVARLPDMMQHKLSDRAFGLMFSTVFSVIAVVGWFFFGVVLDWVIIGAGVLVAVALTQPGVLLPFNRLWGVFAERLGRVGNYLLLGLFFYLFLSLV